MTPKQILDKFIQTPMYFSDDEISESLTFDVAESYAKQTAIIFAKFINENYLYHEDGKWHKSEAPGWGQKTDDEVYDLFIKSLPPLTDIDTGIKKEQP